MSFTTVVTGDTKRQIVDKCREKEAEGYECLRPIEALYIVSKSWKGNFDFSHMEDRVTYKAVMRKEGE